MGYEEQLIQVNRAKCELERDLKKLREMNLGLSVQTYYIIQKAIYELEKEIERAERA